MAPAGDIRNPLGTCSSLFLVLFLHTWKGVYSKRKEAPKEEQLLSF